jgi:hypothetical protein
MREILKLHPGWETETGVIVLVRGERARLARKLGCSRAYVGQVAAQLGAARGIPGRLRGVPNRS